MKKLYLLVVTLLLTGLSYGQAVFINEIHYDNTGGDSGEAVEIAGPEGTNLGGWQLVPYNGSNGQTYSILTLTGIIPNQDDGFGTLSFTISGLQNGAPDGIALVDDVGVVIEFISYEGTLTATNGPAIGMTSIDIGVVEGSGTPIGYSLQKGNPVPVKEESGDFVWQTEMLSTFGSVNTNQNFTPVIPPGDDCGNPIIVDFGADLPYNTTDSTLGRGNTYSASCMGSFDGGEDIHYQLIVPSPMTIEVNYDPVGTWSGIAIKDDCGDAGTCLYSNNSSSSDLRNFNYEFTSAGTYYIMIDTWPSPNYVDFTLEILEYTAPSFPIITCPADVVIDSEPGVCGAVVNFADASAIDPEDGGVPTYQTMGPASGSVFPIGDTIIEFSADDLDGNTSTCQFTVTVNDIEDPVAMCQDLTVELDAMGMVSIMPADIDASSTDNCGGFVLTVDIDTFDCSMVGENTVTLTITDDSGNTDTCTATVTVEDNQAPVVLCAGGGGMVMESEAFDACAMPSGWSLEADGTGYDVEGSCNGSGTDGLFSFSCTDGDYVGFGDASTGTNVNFSGCKAVINDDNAGSAFVGVAKIYSPIIDVSTATAASLSFDYMFNNLGGAIFSVELWDGATWIEVLNTGAVDMTDSPVIDVTAYVNADFQARFIHDDGGSWAWGVVIDNVMLEYELPATPPYEVVLDADGMASVNTMDLLLDVEDNCGYTATVGGSSAATLTTTFVGGNGFAGNMFDVMAISALTVDSFDIHLEAGTTDDIEVYFKTGTYVGSETSAANWTLLDTAAGITSAGDGVPTPLNLDLGQAVAAGELVAFYVTTVNGGTIAYTNGTTTGNLFASDANMEIYEGAGGGYFDVTFNPRNFNGNINYTASSISSTLDLDCTNLGENMIDVTITDNGGNEVMCTATVMVYDETAPVLVCGPEPLVYDTNTVSDSPGLAFGASPSVITSILTVTDDFTLSDLNVDMNITHSYIGDVYMTLTSPAGTEIILWNGTGGSADDIMVVFDDEGTPAAEALSAFDGEDTMGDWTLTIEDTFPALDDGVLNAWGLIYEYSYPNPNPDLFIELGPDGTVTIEPMDVLSTLEEACAIDVMLLDITEFSCDDIGTPTLVTVFANDASGNFASCQVEVNIVDNMEPMLTCPADTTSPFDPATGTYTLPDYFGIGDAFATDNCTDASMLVVTQDPAPGTQLGVNPGGPYVITFTAEDENGNMATCSMNLNVAALGVNDDILESQLAMYPNPATDMVRLVNNSNIALETAMIYDLNGKLVAEFDLQDMQRETTLDISNFSSGVFMVKIIGEEASTVKRLIKE